MSTKEEGEAAIAQLSGKELGGRNLTVNERVPAGRGGERGPRVGRDTARRRADKRADKLEGEIEAALNYVESIRAVSAADWDEIERLRNETQLLLAEMKAA